MTLEALEWCKNHPNYVCDALTPEWFKLRLSGKTVTGSHIGSLMGLNPWGTRESVLAHLRDPKPVHSRHALWGSAMEVPNMKVFNSLTGLKTAPVNAYFETGRVGATIDGIILEPLSGPLASVEKGKEWVAAPTYWSMSMQHLHEARAKHGQEPWLVEMKQTGEKYKTDWGKAKCPEQYWAQVQSQLYVTGLTVGVAVARVGTADMRFSVVYKDDFFIEAMLKAVDEILEEV